MSNNYADEARNSSNNSDEDTAELFSVLTLTALLAICSQIFPNERLDFQKNSNQSSSHKVKSIYLLFSL